MKIYTYDNKIMTVGGKWLKADEFKPDSVIINGIEWMKSNLALDDGGEGIVHIDHVYGYNGEDLGDQYYYTAVAAARITANLPGGWRIPTSDEAGDMIRAVTPEAARSTIGWESEGTNDSGLNFIPYGYAAPKLDENGLCSRFIYTDGFGGYRYRVNLSVAGGWSSSTTWEGQYNTIRLVRTAV